MSSAASWWPQLDLQAQHVEGNQPGLKAHPYWKAASLRGCKSSSNAPHMPYVWSFSSPRSQVLVLSWINTLQWLNTPRWNQLSQLILLVSFSPQIQLLTSPLMENISWLCCWHILAITTHLLASSTPVPPHAMTSLCPRSAKVLPAFVRNSCSIHSRLSLWVLGKGGRKE